MKRLLMAMAFAVLLTVPIFAAEPEEEPTVLTLEEAVELALDDLQIITDMEITMRDLQMNRIWFNDELRRIDSGRGTLQMNALMSAMSELEGGINQLQAAQRNIDQAERPGIALPPGMEDLQLLVDGLMAPPDLTGQIGALQSQRGEIAQELSRLRQPDRMAELRRDAERNLNELDRNTEMIEIGIGQTQLNFENIVRNMVSAQADLYRAAQMAGAGIALAEMNAHRMEVMNSVGMVSTHDLNAVRHGLAQSRTQLDDLGRAGQTLTQNINSLLGLPLTQTTVIDFEREYHEIPEDIEAHIAEIIPNLQSVRNLEIALERAKDARWVYTGSHHDVRISEADRRRAHNPNRVTADLWRTTPTREDEDLISIRTRISLQEAVEQARANLADGIRQAETNILQAYTDLDALHARYAALHLDYDRANVNLAAALTNFDLGLITLFEVEQARLAALTTLLEKDGIRNQKWLLSFQLENPDLL